VAAYSGSVRLDGRDIMRYSDEEFRQNVRWSQISIVPQAAMNALNPVLRIGEQVTEPYLLHTHGSRQDAQNRAREIFQLVGVPEEFLNRYAFELSGGMRQRAVIAMALVTMPVLIILDEPTSALDVLTQANIFNLLKKLKRDLEVSYILITHDIATSSELADKVAVMYAGQIVEVSDATPFFLQPLHPYSRKLMDSVPRLRGGKEPDFILGQPPSLLNPPGGCRFRDRCPSRFGLCEQEPPVFHADRRLVKCWLFQGAQETRHDEP
jgi:oligopeptide/dipeptide ABC transporter ATP-binding protein